MVDHYELESEKASPLPIELTKSAQEAIGTIFAEESDPPDYLRVFVTGGGCSGFQYGFSFEFETEEDDTVFDFGGVKVVVDSMSYQYLVGASIDFVSDNFQENFVIINPAAKTQCGCGQSFSV